MQTASNTVHVIAGTAGAAEGTAGPAGQFSVNLLRCKHQHRSSSSWGRQRAADNVCPHSLQQPHTVSQCCWCSCSAPHRVVNLAVAVPVGVLQGLQHCTLQLAGVVDVPSQGLCELLLTDEAITISVNVLHEATTSSARGGSIGSQLSQRNAAGPTQHAEHP